MTAEYLATGYPTTDHPGASEAVVAGGVTSGETGEIETGEIATWDAERAVVEERILGEVVALLHDVIGEEYVIDLEIDLSTSFNTDLELESIEFVALADRMRERYGDTADFVGFLADKSVDDVINMRVGEVVSFIADCLLPPRS